jgi:beta-galactosidase
VKKNFASILLLLVLQSVVHGEAPSSRERLLLDFGWKFHQGDPEDATANGVNLFDYPEPGSLDKTREKDLLAAAALAATRPDPVATNLGAGVSFVQPLLDDHQWRQINVPHDWVVELPFNPRGDAAHGKKDIDPKKGTNIGWYRRSYDLPAEDADKAVWLEFDGVYRNAVIWLNGHCLGRHVSGYGSFMLDISKTAIFGGRNTLVVRVDATRNEGWFYEGGGIYRHVWLVTANSLHVAHWGTFVTTPSVDEKSATINIETTLTNDSDAPRDCTVVNEISGPDGKPVTPVGQAEQAHATIQVPARGQKLVVEMIKVAQPQLWSPDTPVLYQAQTNVKEGGAVVDVYPTTFGIRTLRWDANEGFFLNGKPVKIQGTCNHQDHAGVGIAQPDRLQEFRIEKLREMGSNAYRTAHSPPMPEMLDACDRLGMMVWDETRRFDDSPLGLAELEAMIRRDRNHPSVILWSIGNEEPLQGDANVGVRIASTLQNLAHQLDPSRMVTMANNGGNSWGKAVSTMIDIMGFNYIKGGNPDRYHNSSFPYKPCIGSEDAATRGTRGAYVSDPANCLVEAYGDSHAGNSMDTEEYWNFLMARPWFSGGFLWSGFDYRGEPNPYKNRGYCCQDGLMDLCGFPKDNFYYCQAWWTDKPMVHLLPHWNWAGKEGQPIDVRCFSNCDQVELFLNNESLGRQSMPKYSHLDWKVNYAPGELSAKAYRGNELVAQQTIQTTGAPAGISLTPDRGRINADGQDVAIVTVAVIDSQGRTVPTASNDISFSIEGAGIIGVGNGDPGSAESDKLPRRKAFMGLAQVIVQAPMQAGQIELTATSPGLKPMTITVSAATSQHGAGVPVINK